MDTKEKAEAITRVGNKANYAGFIVRGNTGLRKVIAKALKEAYEQGKRDAR